MSNQVHSHNTKSSNKFHIKKTNFTSAKNCVKYIIPSLLNETQTSITNEFVTHSVNGFINYVKQYL